MVPNRSHSAESPPMVFKQEQPLPEGQVKIEGAFHEHGDQISFLHETSCI
jgi:hypothetical protein